MKTDFNGTERGIHVRDSRSGYREKGFKIEREEIEKGRKVDV